MKPLMMLLLLFSLISCAQKEDDESSASSSSDDTSADTTQYNACMVNLSVATCINFAPSGFSAAQVKVFCDQMSGTAVDTSCPSTYNSTASSGTCSVTQDSITYYYRFYDGNATNEEGYCNALASGATTTSWTADGGLLTAQSFHCRFQNDQKENCTELKNVNEENALNFCDAMNGYLDSTCD